MRTLLLASAFAALSPLFFLFSPSGVDLAAVATLRVGTIKGKECVNCQTAPAYNCNRCETFPAPYTDPDTGMAYNSLKCDKDLALKCCAGSSGICNDFVAICNDVTEAYTDANCTMGHVTVAIQCRKSTCNTL